MLVRRPDQSVAVQRHTAADAAAVSREDRLHRFAVAAPDLAAADLGFQFLQCVEEPQRGVGFLRGRCRTGEIAVAERAAHAVQHVDAVLLVILFERDARQRHEGFAGDLRREPRIAGHHLRAAVRAPDDELPGRVAQQAVEIDLVGAACQRAVEQRADLGRRGHLFDRRREDHALSLRQGQFEIARRQQVFVPVVAAGQLLRVFESVVPVGCGHEFGVGPVRLEVEPRIAFVEAVLHAALHGVGAAVGLHVGMGQRLLLAIGEEGPQPQADVGRRVEQRVADHQLRALVNPQQLLAQDDAAHAVGDRRGRRVGEVGDVLVAARFVDAAETVDSQIERLIVLDDGLVERRQQHAGLVAPADRGDHQTVVPARIAAYDRGAHVAAAAVGREHLALQRIFEVAQFVLVESKCRHGLCCNS